LEDGAYMHSLVCLKTWRIPWRILLHRFYICCIFVTLSISFSDFLVRFSLPS